MNYKPAIEIAQEEAIDTLFQENHYNDIRKRVDYDHYYVRYWNGKAYIFTRRRCKVDYVDPANVVYSYTEDPYFKD